MAESAQEIEAGRETDAAIHWRVMDKRLLTEGEMRAEARRVWFNQPACQMFMLDGCGFTVRPKTEAARRRGFDSSRPDDIAFEQDLPAYSTDISAAWEVVEKVKGEWYCEIRVEHSGCPTELWDCLILSDGVGGVTGLVSREAGETAPLAICKAARAAIEKLSGALPPHPRSVDSKESSQANASTETLDA